MNKIYEIITPVLFSIVAFFAVKLINETATLNKEVAELSKKVAELSATQKEHFSEIDRRLESVEANLFDHIAHFKETKNVQTKKYYYSLKEYSDRPISAYSIPYFSFAEGKHLFRNSAAVIDSSTFLALRYRSSNKTILALIPGLLLLSCKQPQIQTIKETTTTSVPIYIPGAAAESKALFDTLKRNVVRAGRVTVVNTRINDTLKTNVFIPDTLVYPTLKQTTTELKEPTNKESFSYREILIGLGIGILVMLFISKKA